MAPFIEPGTFVCPPSAGSYHKGMVKKGRAATAALQAVQDSGVAYELIEYEHSEDMQHGFALDTAAVLGLDPAIIFKTLIVEVDREHVVAVVPASGTLSLKALAHAAGGKHAALADPAKAQRLTGYILGGISPLGQRTRLRTFLDATALTHPTIVVSGGKRSLSIRLAPSDLVSLVGAVVAPIADLTRHY